MSDYLNCDYDGSSHKEYVIPQAIPYFKNGTATTYKSDTGSKLTVKAEKTYQFKITASSKPTFYMWKRVRY